MTEVSYDLKAKDQMSSVLDHVTQKFGIFNKAGIGMGIAFAGINIAVGALQQAFSSVVDYVKEGVEANRAFEMSMARLSVSSTDFDTSMGSLKYTLKNFSVMFATDLNTLTDGLRDFIREGYNASESVKLLFNAERLAVVTGDDLTTTQHAMITAMEVFDLSTSDASDIINKFNEITSTTGLTIGDIDNALGRAADSIRTSGVGFSDIVDILYTLENQGYNSRAMLVKLKEILDTFPSGFKIDVMPEGSIPDIDTKFKKISSTVAFTVEQMKQLGTISQMDLTGGLDIGAMFSEEKIKRAKDYFNTLNSQGIKTLEQFNSVAGQTAAKKLNPDFEFIGIDKQLWQLMRTYYQYNDMIDDSATTTSNWADQLKDIQTELGKLNTTLTDSNATLAKTALEIGDLTEMRDFTIAMHNATAAVTKQENAIKSLQRISDAYSLSQLSNSLAIAKIQFTTMGERHGPSREDKEAIAALEKTNAGLQIKEMENQIAIGTIQQNGLYQTQNALDAIKQQHDEAMYTRTIRDLDANIKTQNELYMSTLATITDTNTKISKQQDLWRNSELVKWISWATDMHKWNSYAYSHDGNAPTKITTTPAATTTVSTIIEQMRHGTFGLPHLATGGSVLKTGAAMVHEGESVLSKELVNALMRLHEMPHIDITDIMPREKPDVKSPGVEPRRTETIHFDMPDIKPRELPRMDLPDLRTVSSPVIMSQPSPVILSQPARVEHHHYANVNVNVAEIRQDTDVEAWGRKLGAGLSSAFLESGSSGTTTVTSRKTGASIVVPGTTMTARTGRTPTATLPVVQSIKHKSRFRVG